MLCSKDSCSSLSRTEQRWLFERVYSNVRLNRLNSIWSRTEVIARSKTLSFESSRWTCSIEFDSKWLEISSHFANSRIYNKLYPHGFQKLVNELWIWVPELGFDRDFLHSARIWPIWSCSEPDTKKTSVWGSVINWVTGKPLDSLKIGILDQRTDQYGANFVGLVHHQPRSSGFHVNGDP